MGPKTPKPTWVAWDSGNFPPDPTRGSRCFLVSIHYDKISFAGLVRILEIVNKKPIQVPGFQVEVCIFIIKRNKVARQDVKTPRLVPSNLLSAATPMTMRNRFGLHWRGKWFVKERNRTRRGSKEKRTPPSTIAMVGKGMASWDPCQGTPRTVAPRSGHMKGCYSYS